MAMKINIPGSAWSALEAYKHFTPQDDRASKEIGWALRAAEPKRRGFGVSMVIHLPDVAVPLFYLIVQGKAEAALDSEDGSMATERAALLRILKSMRKQVAPFKRLAMMRGEGE